MGLGFSHGGAHWSYGGFHQFRTEIAAHEGICLEDMVGFGGPVEWKTVKTPIKALLNHSDCEGELSPKKCLKVAPRLLEIVEELWPESDKQSLHVQYNRQSAIALARGMLEAYKEDVPLEFC